MGKTEALQPLPANGKKQFELRAWQLRGAKAHVQRSHGGSRVDRQKRAMLRAWAADASQVALKSLQCQNPLHQNTSLGLAHLWVGWHGN